MKIFKYKLFHQWTKYEKLTNETLKEIVSEIQNGLYEANLGSGLYKKRVAMLGRSKRSSYRTLLAFKKDHRAVFIYGFAKNTRDDINEKEKLIFKQLAKNLLNMNSSQILKMLDNNSLIEVI